VALWLSPLSRITCLIANFQLMRRQSSNCINNRARSLLYPSTIPLNPNCLLLWLDYSICLVQWPCCINNFDYYIPAFKFLSMNFMSCPTERIRFRHVSLLTSGPTGCDVTSAVHAAWAGGRVAQRVTVRNWWWYTLW
jgi:hypothetical protein